MEIKKQVKDKLQNLPVVSLNEKEMSAVQGGGINLGGGVSVDDGRIIFGFEAGKDG